MRASRLEPSDNVRVSPLPVHCRCNGGSRPVTAGHKPDVENGKATFAMNCGVCPLRAGNRRAEQAGAVAGLVGRQGRQPAGFPPVLACPQGLRNHLEQEALDKFLVDPGAMVPGTVMPLQIPDDKTRADVIAYLATYKK